MTATLFRIAATAAALVLIAAPLNVDAQTAAKVHRIGFLSPGSSTAPLATTDAFRHAMRDLGWIEGQNVSIDFRFAEYRYDRLPDLATELVRLPVEVIVAPATPAALAARKASDTVPIVMIGVGDPVGTGLAASLARPGGNVTGLTFSGAAMDLYAKQLELLTQAVPKARRVAILSNPANPVHDVMKKEIKTAGRSLGVQLQFVDVRGPAEFDAAFSAIAKERAGALLVVADSMFLLHRARLAELVAKYRLPMLGYRELVDSGGL